MPDPVSFEYDALGRRLIYTDGDGNQTLYYYDGIRVILEKKKPYYSPTWSTAQVYTLQEGSIGFIISSRDSATGNDTWYHYDRLGTVTNLTNSTGFVTATYDQDAFGNVLTGSPDGFHLTTKRKYTDIGLYYFFQRWYDPESGRFISKSQYSSDIEHFYVYCENNTLNRIDITGEYSVSRCAQAVAGYLASLVGVAAACEIPTSPQCLLATSFAIAAGQVMINECYNTCTPPMPCIDEKGWRKANCCMKYCIKLSRDVGARRSCNKACNRNWNKGG